MIVVQEGEELVVILLQNGIELVIVALRALDRETKHALADGVHAIKQRLHAELFGINAAFLVDHRVAEKTSGNDVVLGGVREEVARELLGDELVVRQIVVEGFHNPIAIERHVARLVFLEAIGVGVTRGIEPVASPLLAIMRRREQTLDLFLVSVRRFVGEKRVHFFRRRRQTDQVERESAQQRRLVCFGRRLEFFRVEFSCDKIINWRARPVFPSRNRHSRTHRSFEAPVIRVVSVFLRAAFPLRALINPRAHQTNLFIRELLLLLRHLRQIGMCARKNLD